VGERSGLTRRAALAAAAIAAVPAIRVVAQAPARIRLATPPNDSGGEAFYGADMGFFTKAGLDVEVNVIGQGGLIPDGLMSGSLDIGGINIPAAALAHERHLPMVLIAPGAVYDSRSPTSALLVAKASSIAGARDLIGKTIGVRDLTNPGSLAARAWLDQNGGDSKSVRFVELPDSASAAALQAGRIDAASIATPFLEEALRGDARILAKSYDAIAKQFMIAGWFSTRDYAARRPDVVRTFDAAIRETARWANANHPRSGEILAKYTKVTVPPTMARVSYAEQSSPALMQPFIDAAAKYGVLHASFPASDLFAP
jgi:ABC-type nitrate/sulfonate/bicarbonate transport system substrate-binding protein